MTDSNGSTPVLEVEGVTKTFPGVLANDNVHLSLRRGEILALLGENGAGKSTLMNIIYGLYHPDKGTMRLKGREVRFASPREAIHSGIGMVHQHFQLVNVMTVAENVILGEEDTVAYRGGNHPFGRWLVRWMPSVIVFLLSVVIGLSLGKTVYAVGGVVAGLALGGLVAVPPAARLVWGVLWRIGLIFVGLAVAVQVEQITRVAITAVALQQQVEILDEKRPKEMDEGYTVKRSVVQVQAVPFNWAREYRDAKDNIPIVIARAQAAMAPYRDAGIPGWLLDAIDAAPPVAEALAVVLMLFVVGAHSVRTWRGLEPGPARPRPHDLALLGAILGVGVVLAWLNLDGVSRAAQVLLCVALIVGLGWMAWRTHQRAMTSDAEWAGSPLDGVLDSALMLLANFTEVRNVHAAAQRVRELSRQYGLEVDPDAVIEKLPVGMQQRVEIIKALYRHADILILDEPTAVLTPQEGRELFKIMRELAAQGVSIIFITHKLKEVFEVATNIVVMRDGHVVGTTTPDQATETSLAAMMVGREVILQVDKAEAQPRETVLEVTGLSAIDDRGARALNEVHFAVRAGEVLGIAGVQGNGQTELVEVLTGLRELAGGTVRLLGMDLQSDEQPDGGLWARAGAFVLDALLLALLSYFVGFFVWYFRDGSFGLLSAVLTVLIVDALYTYGAWLAFRGTLGMALLGLEVSDLHHDVRPGALRLLRRYVIYLALRIPLFVPLIAAFELARRRGDTRCWYDDWSGVRVIRRARITPRRIKDVGTSHVPEDRQRHGLVKRYTVGDNLVLNDYYERPFAKAPNAAELPGTLLRYLLLTGGLIALFTVIALALWDAWLWTALLDAYRVPENLREIGRSLGENQKAALQYPLIVSVLLLIAFEIVVAIVAHQIANRILGTAPVRGAIARFEDRARAWWWRATGREGTPPEPQGGLLRDEAVITAHARRLIERFDIRTPGPELEGGNLSGGNQQKLIVAREFSRTPRLLIAAQPTRGIDVGSIEFIHNQIVAQRDAGAAVLLVSAELDEIMALSDRIAVLYKGEVIDTLPAREATREQLGLLMAGIHNR